MKDYSFDGSEIFKRFVYPTLLVLVLPLFSWWFFNHAESRMDREVLAAIEESVQNDPDVPDAEKAKILEFFREMPMSRVLRSNNPELRRLGDDLTARARFDYATFRWMIRLSLLSMVASIAALAFLGFSAVLFVRSQWAQYVNLLVGWYALRIFATFQVIVQGVLLFALSFWITALWFDVYFPQLLVISGILIAGSAWAVLAAVFKRVKRTAELDGKVLERERAPELWRYLDELSRASGTDPPDQLVAGIDGNFFVTELPVEVDGKKYRGRTLYVGLPLLKAFHEREANAAFAHELAHFSGQDTFYARKITPLLARYDLYIEALQQGVFSLLVLHHVLLFRFLHAFSLQRYSREREFRADRIAAEYTSRRDMAGSLLRVAAYSKYRGGVEQELFDAQEAHDVLRIGKRIEEGFPDFAVGFAEHEDFGDVETVHPFDSHPSLQQRLEAIGFTPTVPEVREILSEKPDGGWFWKIAESEELEAELWSEYEEHFRAFHEEVLVFRYLPSTDEELAFVEKSFPEVTFTTHKGTTIVFDCLKITTDAWEDPVYYSEIESITAETEWGKPRLRLKLNRDGVRERLLPLSKKASAQQEVVDTLQRYAGRYEAAAEYQRSLEEPGEGPEEECE